MENHQNNPYKRQAQDNNFKSQLQALLCYLSALGL